MVVYFVLFSFFLDLLLSASRCFDILVAESEWKTWKCKENKWSKGEIIVRDQFYVEFTHKQKSRYSKAKTEIVNFWRFAL